MLDDLGGTGIFSEELAGDYSAVRADWSARGEIDAATAESAVWENWTIVGDVAKVRAVVDAEPLCHVAIVNTDDECVIGGAPVAVERALLTLLDDPTIQATALPQRRAGHVPEAARVAEA